MTDSNGNKMQILRDTHGKETAKEAVHIQLK